ncbi:APC family permease [Naasia sp. SYSU D00948]|uniref:APC family permease n=1 Tax=Naasia sp. SYSU D00948 TaxID=2817379 RepID=UPI001B30F671|nr:APC family permease [Naasia sp. SYSU D00948]
MTDLTPPRTDSSAPSRENAGGEGDARLRRGVGSFGSFAAGFSFVSILTTVFQLFGLGFGFGGAAFFWTWPLVFAGQLLVSLCFAELVARYPISGAIFQWSSRLAGTDFGWFTGWVMVIGQILTVATAAIALQTVLPHIWPGFQIVGGPGASSDPTSATGAQNAVLLGLGVLVITTVINAVGVRLMAIFNSVGVTVEILGVMALIVVLLLNAQRGPEIVLTNTGAAEGPYLPLWLASSLVAAYVLVGLDSAGELSEETRNPRRTTPRTIIRALIASGLGGLLLMLAGILAAPSLTNGSLAHGGLAWVLLNGVGGLGAQVLLLTVAMAIFACTLAVQASGTRMLFSMAREGTLPFSSALSSVSPRTGTPVWSVVVVGAGAAITLAVNWNQQAVFTALASTAVAMLYLAYLGVTLPLLLKRMRRGGLERGVAEDGRPLFSLGRLGVPLTLTAVLYQIGMVVNLLWPRAEIYDLTGGTWWLQWSALLFLGLILLVGSGIHFRTRLRRRGPIVLEPVETSAQPGEIA